MERLRTHLFRIQPVRALSTRMDSYVIHYISDEIAFTKRSIAQSLNSEEEIVMENRRRWSKVWVAGAPELGRHVLWHAHILRLLFLDSPTHFDHLIGYLPSAFLLSITLSTSAALLTSPFLFLTPLFLLALPSPFPSSLSPSPSQALSFTLLSSPSS